MWANNETGTIFPVEEMAEMAHAKGILFHTDAVQAVGKVAIDLKTRRSTCSRYPATSCTRPKASACSMCAAIPAFRPLLRGGHQERGRRAGTENSASIVGLGVACELASSTWWPRTPRSSACATASSAASSASVRNAFVNGDTLYRLPNTASIAFEYVEGEGILLLLNKLALPPRAARPAPRARWSPRT
jgi:cysteine desulfurase